MWKLCNLQQIEDHPTLTLQSVLLGFGTRLTSETPRIGFKALTVLS